MILTTQIIEKKRDGLENTPEELHHFFHGYLEGSVKDYQMSAWLMAVCCRGVSSQELKALTEIMWKSGKTFPRSQRKEFWIDKHSTGGVGDKTSLILVPLITAVCERKGKLGKIKIPMVSGRGLGHSGGTLDKLESLPGFSSSIDMPTALDLLERNHFFMMGQTQDLAPLDRLLYALRDVTGTVESIPLIVSSIMSKKLSENLDGIVFDVKTGEGAFMVTEKQSKTLARSLVKVAESQKVAAVAVVTRMDEPLGFCVGNFLEVEECYDYLLGVRREQGLHQVVMELGSQMLHLSSKGKMVLSQAKKCLEEELQHPEAAQIFQKMFTSQGGTWEKFEEQKKRRLTETARFDVEARQKGWVHALGAREIGFMLIDLGGGRKVKEDKIDPLVGFEIHKKVGETVRKGDKIMTVYCRPGTDLGKLKESARKICRIHSRPAKKKSWVLARIS